MHIDIHQHVWPDALVTELRRRSQPPRLDGWTLLTAGEPPYAVNPADHDAGRRARQAADDGVGLGCAGLAGGDLAANGVRLVEVFGRACPARSGMRLDRSSEI